MEDDHHRTADPIKAVIVQHHNAIGAGAKCTLAEEALTTTSSSCWSCRISPIPLRGSRTTFFRLRTALRSHFLVAYGTWVSRATTRRRARQRSPEFEDPGAITTFGVTRRPLGQAEIGRRLAKLVGMSSLNRLDPLPHARPRVRGPLVGEDARALRPSNRATRRSERLRARSNLRPHCFKNWGLDPLPDYRLPGIFARAGNDFPLILMTGGRTIEGFHQNATDAVLPPPAPASSRQDAPGDGGGRRG